MKKETYTEKETWEHYWNSYQPEKVVLKNQFQKLFRDIENANQNKTFIEIGGFPGVFSIYFKKFKGYKVTLLDYFISKPVINRLLKVNGMKEADLEVIEADFLKEKSKHKTYDLVFSSGFIEHFEDTGKIIRLHTQYMSGGATLLLTLPNLRGLNGWVQRKFHRTNYDIHNIKCMDIEVLREHCKGLNLSEVEIDYHGKPMVWLEPSAPVSELTRKLVKMLSLFIKLFPVKGSFLSPYLYIKAKK